MLFRSPHPHQYHPVLLSQSMQRPQLQIQNPKHLSYWSFGRIAPLCNQMDYNDVPMYDGPDGTNDDKENTDDDVCVGGGNTEEEECEIDWSKMPGSDDTNNYSDHNNNNNNVSDNSLSDNDRLLRAQLERQFQMPSSISSSTTTNTVTNNEKESFETATTSPPLEQEDITIASQSSSSSSTSNMMSDFQRLEMIWQQREESTECDIYTPVTCGGQTCTTCSGTGHTACRFCRGTKFLYLPITSDVVSPDSNNNNHIMRGDDFEITQRPATPQPPQSSKNTSYISCSICATTGTEICRTCQGSGWIAHWTQLGVRVGDILK